MTTTTGSMTALDWAMRYIARGWSPVDVPHGSKAPIRNGWESLRIDRVNVHEYFNCRPSNMGIQCGSLSGGLVDVDCDIHEAIAAADILLPKTKMQSGRKSARRSHRWYQSVSNTPDTTRRYVFGKVGTIVELRTTGGQTIVPPSIHPEGEPYEWEGGGPGEPTEIDGKELAQLVARVAAASLLARHYPAEGARHDFCMALAGALLRNGYDPKIAECFVWAVVSSAGDDESEDRLKAVDYTRKALETGRNVTGIPRLKEIIGEQPVSKAAEWLGLSRLTDAVTVGEESEVAAASTHLTELGNAKRLIKRHGADMRFCAEWGKWFVFTGKRWEPDKTGQVTRWAIETVTAIYEEAAQATDSEQRKALVKHAIASEKAKSISNMITLAQSAPKVAIIPDDLDFDPWVFNCANGTLNLRTGKLQPHDRNDLITKIADVEYDEFAECPRWLAFLSSLHPADVQTFLKTAVGYTFTGDTSEQCLFFLHGAGRNGKTTFTSTLERLFGDYWQRIRAESLMRDPHGNAGGATPEIAALHRARLVTVSEIDQGHRLNESLIKDMTGGDMLVARRLYQEPFAFRPTHKTWICGNYKPRITGTDEGIWRRQKLIPFTTVIAEEDVDPKLSRKLAEELSGILNWALEGCEQWQDKGLQEPDAVRNATAAYRSEMDVLGAFIAEKCAVHPQSRVKGGDLYGAYKRWCEDGSERAVTGTEFGRRLTDRGYPAQKKSGNVYRIGIELATTSE